MKYKIGIDFTYIMDNSVTGIRKYGEGILEGIKKLNKDYEIVLFVNDTLEKSFKKKFSQYKIVTIKFWLKDVRYIRRINVFNFTKSIKMKKEKCDVIIYPYVCKYTKIIDNQKKIITIQDVIPLDEIKDKKSNIYQKIKKENVDLMNQSKYIMTISNYSKKRLLEINPEFKGEITVVPNSIEKLKESTKKVSEIIKTDKPYIFSVNSFLKHKNQITLVKAFNKIKDKIPHNLVLLRKTRNRTCN